MTKISVFILMAFIALNSSLASPTTTVEFIKVDQFGYKANLQKIAVISDPQTGFNSALAFAPSTAANQYQIRRWSDDAIMYTGTITPWNAGATYVQSGDKIWYFDFSTFVTPGNYYVFDIGNNVGSYQFTIDNCVYNDVLKHAVRTFYYQRSGFAKTAAYAGAGWTDVASHTGSQQDLDCRLYSNTSVATSKNLSGGWYDAGDLSKYVNFTWGTLNDLLTAYEENPTVWGDNYNIPESGNGVPDLLDEVKYELDWLLKMQQPDGSVFSIVGHGFGSPPSADASPARYGPINTSSALTCASIFALAAIQYNTILLE